MKLKQIGSNVTELSFQNVTVLFSYQTPVAMVDANGNYYVTDKKWSATTTRHINKWVGGNNAQVNPQSFFDALLKQEVSQ